MTGVSAPSRSLFTTTAAHVNKRGPSDRLRIFKPEMPEDLRIDILSRLAGEPVSADKPYSDALFELIHPVGKVENGNIGCRNDAEAIFSVVAKGKPFYRHFLSAAPLTEQAKTVRALYLMTRKPFSRDSDGLQKALEPLEKTETFRATVDEVKSDTLMMNYLACNLHAKKYTPEKRNAHIAILKQAANGEMRAFLTGLQEAYETMPKHVFETDKEQQNARKNVTFASGYPKTHVEASRIEYMTVALNDVWRGDSAMLANLADDLVLPHVTNKILLREVFAQMASVAKARPKAKFLRERLQQIKTKHGDTLSSV